MAKDAFRELLLLSDTGSGDDADDADTDDNLHHMLVAIAQAVAQRAAAEISGTRMLATADAETVTSVVRDNSSYYLTSKVLVVAKCARDGGAADCVRCLQDSARAVGWDRGDLVAARDLVAAVVGFNCYHLNLLLLCLGLGVSVGVILACLCGFVMSKRERAKREKMDAEKMDAAVAGEYIK